MSNSNTIFWHDYETWGSNPRKDRPSQFAGIRTDEDLNIVDDPVVFYCKPAPDFLPHPEACLVTGITPQKALAEGINEAEFAARIVEQFTQPNTCVSGYNSIRFDDEVTRHLFYRCFYDPYEREWKNGNSRWDIIDLVRTTYALRPDGVNWPKKEDGRPSFRLQELTVANDIEHSAAHDALADVIATIEMAKRIKLAQPKLYDFLYQHRRKNRLQPLLNLKDKPLLVHVSGMYPSTRGCLGIVLPLMQHPKNSNGVIVADVSTDPAQWLNLDVEEMRYRLFTPGNELPENMLRAPLKTIHLNKCPSVAPTSVLDNSVLGKYDIDLETCARHREMILTDKKLKDTLYHVFANQEMEPETNPDLMLYSGGFFSDKDRQIMKGIHQLNPSQLNEYKPDFEDQRLQEMLFRFRARNYPDYLTAEERDNWNEWRRDQLRDNPSDIGLSLSHFYKRIDELLATCEEKDHKLLNSLDDYGKSVENSIMAVQ